MPKMKLTAKAVENAKVPASGQVEYFDEALPGFALRVTASGRKSWVLFYRVQTGPERGKQRRLTLAHYPLLSLADARAEAHSALQAIERGGDPAKEKQAVRTAVPDKVYAFDAVADEYLEQYAKPKKRSWKDDEIRLRVHVRPTWGRRSVGSITRGDVDELIDGIAAKGTPIAANRTLAVVRKLFNWAVTKPRFKLDASPVVRIEAPGAETRRDRWLRDDEVCLFWRACDAVGYPFGPFAQILLLTAARREMVAAMRRTDVDAVKRLWTVPGSLMKSGREHVVPLSPLALSIIEAQPQIAGTDYLFPAQRVRSGNSRETRHISGFSAAKRQIDAAMLVVARSDATVRGLDPAVTGPIPDWTFHDLRRTATTHMGELRVPRHVRKLILDHVVRDVTGIYDRYEYLDERRDGLERWAAKVEQLAIAPSSGVFWLWT